MFRVENTNKIFEVNTPQREPHHIVSNGVINKGNTCYFYPSVLFPEDVEICSSTFIYRSETGVVNVKFVIVNTTSGKVEENAEYGFAHKTLISSVKYDKPLLIKAGTPFYFYVAAELKDSFFTLGYKNI